MVLPGRDGLGAADVVVGEVLLIHIRDDIILPDGRIDVVKVRPLARLGYYEYTTIESTFEMWIPGATERLMGGLEGDARRTR